LEPGWLISGFRAQHNPISITARACPDDAGRRAGDAEHSRLLDSRAAGDSSCLDHKDRSAQHSSADPAQYADDGASVLATLTRNDKLLRGFSNLYNAINDRLLAESTCFQASMRGNWSSAFRPTHHQCRISVHAAPGARASQLERGAWYASFELKTSQVEAAYHASCGAGNAMDERRSDYADYLADFHADSTIYAEQGARGLSLADGYKASQKLGLKCWKAGRRELFIPARATKRELASACFRPVLVSNARKGKVTDSHSRLRCLGSIHPAS